MRPPSQTASIVYWILWRLVVLFLLRRRSDDGEAVEILVQRHELAVLRRQVARRRYILADRVARRACRGASSRPEGTRIGE